ncbi:MAG: gamma-glutamyl-gamma-aminobutyrate hydrolase family protein [Firmicutes bacterium]|nr:gamma-glutamyl-gamma-aminobutyrate hydrolase family protein [Bacillota bacterium]
MGRPLVAVTCQHIDAQKSAIGDGYIEALEQAGLLPVVLPPSLSPEVSCEIISTVSGLVLSGGDDLSPLSFGEQPKPGLGTIEPRRDEQELPLFKAAWERELPVLGICRGMQVINVALGGTIIQDLPADKPGAIQHRQDAPKWHKHHQVEIKQGTNLATIMNTDSLAVNSFHHQALDRIADGLEVSARAPDGVVEAVESASPWLLAVQWHPEIMWQRHPEFLKLFQAFAAACGA